MICHCAGCGLVEAISKIPGTCANGTPWNVLISFILECSSRLPEPVNRPGKLLWFSFATSIPADISYYSEAVVSIRGDSVADDSLVKP